MGNAAPMIAMYFGRCRGVVVRAVMVCDMSCRPAELIPWTTRAVISHTMLWANPQARDASTKTASDARNTRARTRRVADPAEHGQQHGARERVADDDPAHVLERAELPGDGGERGRDDGVVEGAEERHGEQGDEQDPEAGGGEEHGAETRSGGRRDRL